MTTMKAVAHHARVSTATVSHVLNGTRFVDPDTVKRVLDAVEELRYEMNGSARSLRAGTTSTFALIVPDLSNPFFPEIAVVIQQEAAAVRYDVVIYSTDVPHGASDDLLRHYLRTIRGQRYDAVIYAETMCEIPMSTQELVDAGSPVVLIGGTPHPQTDRVYIDDYAAAREVMSYLTDKGHTRIAHILGAPGMASSEARLRGYRDGLTAAGIPLLPAYEAQGTFLREGGYQAMELLLRSESRPTAVFAANDLTALGAMLACFDSHVPVPDEIAIVGFDDISLAANTRPALTTVYHGQRETGHEAVRLALQAHRRRLARGGSQEGEPPKETVIVPHRLVIRDSA